MAINTLQEKFLHGLGDIYDAEHQFLEAQQEMLPQANSTTVKSLLEQHISETEGQISVLEQVFAAIGETPERETCAAAAGIVKENEKTLSEVSDNPTLVDLAISGGSSKVEHYEIANYRMLITGAQQMGLTQVAQLLQQNLQQEEATAQKIEQSAPTLFQQAMKQEQGRSAGA
jgi:ferritin-like metal-binding protein YciE